MPKNKEPQYTDQQAVRVRLDENTEYVAVIIDDVDIGVGLGAGPINGLKGEVRGGRKRTVLAQYIRDSDYGLLPHGVWEEKKRIQVAGTLPPHMDTSVDHVIVSGAESIETTICLNCMCSIPVGSKYCNFCGSLVSTE